MDIQILQLIEGARQARGLTVIIDVFRAFSAEAFMAGNHAAKIIPVGDVQAAFDYKAKHPDAILCGEREGKMIEGFDYGNSPSQLEHVDLTGKTVVHTTSAGTQGIANAIHAEEILGGSLLTARAIANYIRRKNPETVSLVCMGLMAEIPTEEDTLCAEYIKHLLEEKPFPEFRERLQRLRYTDGAKFFDPDQQQVFPQRDFELCVKYGCVPFVLRLTQDPEGGPAYMERVEPSGARQAPAEDTPITQVNPGDMLSQFTRQEVLALPEDLRKELVYGRLNEPDGTFDCALVLGGPIQFMASRAQTAAKLYREGRVPQLIVTGGVYRDCEFGWLSEAQILHRYLIQEGVPENCIIVEDAATTTLENFRNSEQMLPKPDMRIAVVTSNFHAYRAGALAQSYFPQHKIFSIGARYPYDNAQEYTQDETMYRWVKNECRCIWGICKSGRIPDLPVL